MVNWMHLELIIGQIAKDVEEIKGSIKEPEIKIDYDILAQKIVDRLKSQEVP